MSINFSVSDIVVVSVSYVDITLKKVVTIVAKTAVATLGVLNKTPATVVETGISLGRSYLRVVPIDTGHTFYNGGVGINVLFDNDTQLNNSFELSNAFFCDYLGKKVFNDTGSTLPKGSAVFQSGFNIAGQLPEVSLASAAGASTAFFFGFLEETIANQGCGSCLVGGSLVADTSGMVQNDSVYLSNTPGGFNLTSTPGGISVILGQVSDVGSSGSFRINGQQLPAPTGGGSGSQGVTGLQGDTGIKGCTGLGVTGIQGSTGAQGGTGLAGNPGAPGAPGSQGITGVQGNTGVGTQGDTGIQGNTGVRGNTGVGTQGNTGVQGVTGFGVAATGTVKVLATLSPLNFDAGATTINAYFTTPPANTVVTSLVVRLLDGNLITSAVTVSAGWSASTTNVFAPAELIGVTLMGDLWTFAASAKSVVGGEFGITGIFLVGVTGLVGNTGMFALDVIGYEDV